MPVPNGGNRSETARTLTLKVLGGSDELIWPIVTKTTVMEVKEKVAEMTMMEPGALDFYYKAGAYLTKQKDIDQIQGTTYVKGVKAFAPAKHVWPHTIGILGAGYHALKTAITYAMDDNFNITLWDRNEIPGGYCWITGANKTSRLQTELGSFHVWWGRDCINSGKVDYPNCREITETHPDAEHPEGKWTIWPYKKEIQKMFNHAAEAFGIKPYIQFSSNVASMEIIGDKTAEDRYYKLSVEDLKKPGTMKEYRASVFFSYPGSLTQNRIIDYPGEDIFGGEIRYGMNDDTPYEALKDSTIAILGNGAFAVENARTCLECEGKKAYIITRRKNLASPRIPCWFVHQGPFPTPGGFVLKTFEPMYELVDFGDPWKFWSVHANSDRSNVSIIQNSRFGIGDVTFLMCAWNLLEYKVATVKRMSKNTLHLSTGEKIEDVTVVLKALGLLGDWSVDKLHNMKEMVGPFCGGDWRRVLMIDATGMNAANFTTFSTGIGTTDFAISQKYMYDYPKEFYRMEAAGLMKMMPRHKEEPELEKPAYLTDVKFAMTGGVLMDGMLPRLQPLKSWMSEYKYNMYHTSHNTDRVLEVALFEWNKYQETWKNRGIEHDYVPYPYTKEIVSQWFEDWSKLMKIPIDVNGPPPGGWHLANFFNADGTRKE